MEKLKSWLSAGRGRCKSLAAHLGVPQSFVSKMASGEKSVPVEHGLAIEQFTGGAFLRREYWPHKCGRIWPDLADPQPNTAAAPAQQAPAAINSEALHTGQEVAHV